MEKLTLKQRRELYMDAAQLICDNKDVAYLCWAFGILLLGNENYFLPTEDRLPIVEGLLPEFHLFRNMKAADNEPEYWGGSETEARILGALFMYEMCKD